MGRPLCACKMFSSSSRGMIRRWAFDHPQPCNASDLRVQVQKLEQSNSVLFSPLVLYTYRIPTEGISIGTCKVTGCPFTNHQFPSRRRTSSPKFQFRQMDKAGRRMQSSGPRESRKWPLDSAKPLVIGRTGRCDAMHSPDFAAPPVKQT